MENFAEELKNIEGDWQEKWEREGVHSTEMDDSTEKYYVLEMFPYPSGSLHMGHVRNYSLGDVLARFKRMQGYNVIHPMGWDSFGLPAENAAIDRGADPEEWTFDCIDTMKEQLRRFGFSYDWDREVATCEPDYYRWNQWIFLKMLEEDLAYRGEANVNWCPGCETVLADEQVEEGTCWRCDSIVKEKEMEQWFLKITDYADSLLNDLDTLDGWPGKVKKMQHDWIGKSHGASIDFPLKGGGSVEVFTTRPDTIYGATFMVLAPEHPLAEEIAEEDEEVGEYIVKARRKDTEEREEKSKEGVFTGRYAVNPMTEDDIPIYISEFVLMDYGTGAIMAVPAHDQRDHDFAVEHDIDIRPVVEGGEDWDPEEEAFEEDGIHINSGELDGLDNEGAKEKIIEILDERGIGEADVNFRLRDWLISRQRYWGTPIPVIYCEDCGAVPVPEEDLPVELPEDVEFTGEGNPVETAEGWIEAECPECGKEGKRETDTMDTFVDSSWYFLRYCSPDFGEGPFDVEEANYWMNVDQYIGGIEHAVLHLMYARFFTKFLRDIDLVDEVEPFERLLTQGMVLHPAYRTKDGEWLYPEEAEEYDGELAIDGDVIAMSKSKKNVVDPQNLVEEYGADTARLFITRAALPTRDLEWSDKGVKSSLRMIERVHRLVEEEMENVVEDAVDLEDASLEDRIVMTGVQRSIESVTEHLEGFEFNLAIDEIDRLLTRIYWYVDREHDGSISSYAVRRLLEMLSPFVPHVTDHLWESIGEKGFLIESGWPEPDEEFIDREAEEIDGYFTRVSGDVREIGEVVGGPNERIKIIQSSSWKYDVEGEILERVLSGERDVGSIMEDVMDEGIEKHGESVSYMVQEAVENPGNFEKRYMTEDMEERSLEQNVERLEEEFQCEVEIEREDESDEEKADRSRPGKPAIVIE